MTREPGRFGCSIADMRKFLAVAVAVAALGGLAQAQRSKYTSPAAEASVVVGGSKIRVDYYAPSMHGRKVMGGLVPFGEVWCTGANIATGFTTEADLKIGDLRLPRGTYSIWTLPTAKEWTLIVNKESGQFHLDYKPSLDLGRTRMQLRSLAAPVETFRVELRSTGDRSGELALLWENTEAWIPFSVIK
jgi:hypothetical protein